MSIGVTILLSMTMFLNMVAQTMPVTSDNPLLGNNDRLPVGAYRQIDRQNMYVCSDRLGHDVYKFNASTYILRKPETSIRIDVMNMIACYGEDIMILWS
jgi:hypothetical protein